MRGGENEKWKVVQRRKKNQVSARLPHATPFYVAGMSDSTSKSYLIKCFRDFGEVVDVFMGRRKDVTWKNFAFVKFEGVRNVGDMEKALQGIVCGGKTLSVNAARYKRNSKKHAPAQPSVRAAKKDTPVTGNGVNMSVTGMSSGSDRSYVEAICGRKCVAVPPSPPPAPIRLVAKGTPRNWLSESVLVGEALSLDHLAAMPNHFLNGDGIIDNIKYVGGMNVAICFKSGQFAEDFLADSDRWIEWLQWVKKGGSWNPGSERIAWVKVIGLPMKFWDDDCLRSITNSFGKIIIPADEIGGGADSSIIKVGIQTNKKNWINAEVVVHEDSDCFNIGLVEFDHPWNPFPCPTFVSDGSDASYDSNGDDISDSDMDGSDRDNMEEGEI
ncbi:hypothetical protein LXL04_029610 [Taraxacum kok-saghyz]